MIPVLLYHSVSATRRDDPWQVAAADFREDMAAVVASGRTPLTATRYAAALRGAAAMPDRPVLITFDDGFADFADEAAPILAEFGLPATIFVTTGWIGTTGMLSAAAVRDVAAGGSVEVGAHSVTHPHLDLLGRRAARDEIGASKTALEDLLGGPVTSFAFPHGSHRRQTVAAVRDAGFDAAFAVKNALSHAADEPFTIARYTVRAATTRGEVAAVLSGAGAPPAWHGERLITTAYRAVRYARYAGRPVAHPIEGWKITV
ncbi:polysaccharide deacetylase family protein [Actinoplanes ianthinogenes]|uniref:polysaccharide deacetylase family protein n=1 Tax=Actinoplanes ianthinogenes TaxID=122358 RepID=UPI0016702568|nr:polysaccharide deacetylase family protein [Actinoplanes ianthinogenes]